MFHFEGGAATWAPGTSPALTSQCSATSQWVSGTVCQDSAWEVRGIPSMRSAGQVEWTMDSGIEAESEETALFYQARESTFSIPKFPATHSAGHNRHWPARGTKWASPLASFLLGFPTEPAVRWTQLSIFCSVGGTAD